VEEKEAVAALSSAANANIVGSRALAAAKKAGLPTSRAMTIEGVPHLQVYRMPP